MFEKEAEEYVNEEYDFCYYPEDNLSTRANAERDWQKGAEFGFNKANEWHYVKDGDLPNKKLEEKQLLVRVRNYTEDCIFAYYMLDKYYSKNGKRFYSDIDCDYPIDIEDIIAWKGIVLPKLKEGEK